MVSETTAFDPTDYTQRTRRGWDLAAPAWRQACPILEAGGRQVSHTLVELAGIGPGDRVLDLAAGYGEPALTAAHVVGPDGQVLAADLSAGMLAVARERAREAGLDNVDLIEGDAEKLDLPEAGFDAVVCRQGLQFLADVPATLARVQRALKPGGRLAAATWAGPPRVQFAAPVGAIMRELNLPPPTPGRPGLFALSDPEKLQRLVEGAGFTDVRTGTVSWPIDVESAEAWIAIVKGTARAVTSRVEEFPAEDQERAWAAATEALRPFETGGRLHLDNEAIWVSGAR